MEKVIYKLDGLDCANCAAKIEDRIKQLDKIDSAVLDFSQSKLVMQVSSTHDLLEDITSIVQKLEPHVAVYPFEEHKDSIKNFSLKDTLLSKETLRLVLSLGFFVGGLLTDGGISLGLLGIAYVVSGYKVIMKSVNNIRQGDFFDENFLMSLATIGAIGIGEYPEAAAVMIFYEIGEFFQDLAVDKSRASITALMNIRPDKATVLTPNGPVDQSPDTVQVGDIIRVIPGERIPLDGIITKGDTLLDTSALTGESKPQSVTTGDDVISGAVVTNKPIEIKVTKLFSESTVARILNLVENATANKAKTENFITKFARYYTPIVVLAALLIVFIPTFIYGFATFDTWLYRGLIFLVVSCPCALVVSIPLGFFSGIGNASKHGILIKGSNYLEALNTIDTVVFDKTGTLTKGVFSVHTVKSYNQFDDKALVEAAAQAEKHSTHPIGKSIIRYRNERFGNPNHMVGFEDLTETFEEVSGHGIKAYVSSKHILAGNAKLLEGENITFEPVTSVGTVVYIAIDKIYAGYIELKDTLKTDAKATIESLHSLGKSTLMLTGDHEDVAASVAQEIGIGTYLAKLLPEDKYENVKSRIDKGERIVFVGDGINDAPVLAAASVGISMGSIGSDAAIEASDIVFMDDEPSKLPIALKIAQKTRTIVTQNIVFALGIKLLIMILGTIGLGTMWMAIFADVGVALLAILNAMRILYFNPKNAI